MASDEETATISEVEKKPPEVEEKKQEPVIPKNFSVDEIVEKVKSETVKTILFSTDTFNHKTGPNKLSYETMQGIIEDTFLTIGNVDFTYNPKKDLYTFERENEGGYGGKHFSIRFLTPKQVKRNQLITRLITGKVISLAIVVGYIFGAPPATEYVCGMTQQNNGKDISVQKAQAISDYIKNNKTLSIIGLPIQKGVDNYIKSVTNK